MNGQLWQECYCGTEPVCSSCEKCAKHCKCGKRDNKQRNANRREINKFLKDITGTSARAAHADMGC